MEGVSGNRPWESLLCLSVPSREKSTVSRRVARQNTSTDGLVGMKRGATLHTKFDKGAAKGGPNRRKGGRGLLFSR